MLSFHEEFPLNAGRLAQAPQFSDTVHDIVLAADTLLRVAVPAGARFVALSFDGDVRVKAGLVDTALTLPLSTATDGAGSVLNPGIRRLPPAATHLCLRAATACKGSLEYWG
jgi:hypothetical protein